MQTYIKALNIKCTDTDICDFKIYIEYNVNYIVTIEKHCIDDKFIRVLVFDNELCENK